MQQGLLFNGILLFARTVVRVVDLAGGLEGPLGGPALPNTENIILFVAILVITILHPAINLRATVEITPPMQQNSHAEDTRP